MQDRVHLQIAWSAMDASKKYTSFKMKIKYKIDTIAEKRSRVFPSSQFQKPLIPDFLSHVKNFQCSRIELVKLYQDIPTTSQDKFRNFIPGRISGSVPCILSLN